MRLKTLEEFLKTEKEATHVNPFWPGEGGGKGFSAFVKRVIWLYTEYLRNEKVGAEAALKSTRKSIEKIKAEIADVQSATTPTLIEILTKEVAGNRDVLKNLIRETGLYVEYVQNCLAEIKDVAEDKTLRGEATAFVRQYFPNLFSSARETLALCKKQYAAVIDPARMPEDKLAGVAAAKLKTLTDGLTQLEAQEVQYGAHGKRVNELLKEAMVILN